LSSFFALGKMFGRLSLFGASELRAPFLAVGFSGTTGCFFPPNPLTRGGIFPVRSTPGEKCRFFDFYIFPLHPFCYLPKDSRYPPQERTPSDAWVYFLPLLSFPNLPFFSILEGRRGLSFFFLASSGRWALPLPRFPPAIMDGRQSPPLSHCSPHGSFLAEQVPSFPMEVVEAEPFPPPFNSAFPQSPPSFPRSET